MQVSTHQGRRKQFGSGQATTKMGGPGVLPRPHITIISFWIYLLVYIALRSAVSKWCFSTSSPASIPRTWKLPRPTTFLESKTGPSSIHVGLVKQELACHPQKMMVAAIDFSFDRVSATSWARIELNRWYADGARFPITAQKASCHMSFPSLCGKVLP